jgi:hypothetical protein
VSASPGSTGSLGSHLIAHSVSMLSVKTVICINRRSRTATRRDAKTCPYSFTIINTSVLVLIIAGQEMERDG